jgi:hypothetical protein
MPRRRAPAKRSRARRAGNPLSRPLTLKWIGGIVAASVTALVAFEGAGHAWNYFGLPHLATEEWTNSLVTKAVVEVKALRGRIEALNTTAEVLGLQNRLVSLQANRDAISREKSQIEFTMKTVKDVGALDFIKHRLETVEASAKMADREIDRVNSQIAVAQNPTGNKRPRGGGENDKANE